MQSHASVVVVGAGIVGSTAAYHLTKRGWRDVVVVDQGPLFETGGSTSHAPGLVFQTNGSRTMAEFAKRTVQLYASLELDGLPCWHPVGSIEVARTPERLHDLKRRLGWARSYGIEAELIGPAEVARRIPILNPKAILGGYHVPTDGLAKAVRACEAQARMARAAGAVFHGETTVTGFEIERGRVRAVVTDRGRIATDMVLLACGIWGPKVGRLAGVSIPLAVCQHQYLRTGPIAELADDAGTEIVHPVLRDQDRDLYERQHGDCYGVGSYAHEPLLFEPEAIPPPGSSPEMPSIRPFTPEHFGPAWESAVELLPALRGATTTFAMNGMFSFTPDGFPLIGEAANARGFWVAEAVWVTHGGGVGRTVADLMTDGFTELDLHEYDLNRFEPHARTRAYARARGAQNYREVYDVIHPLQQMEHPRLLRKSSFYEQEQALGACFFEARGWERPHWYAANEALLAEYDVPRRGGWAAREWSPISGAEALATRDRAALFDMTTLAKMEVSGPGALAFLQGLTTNQLDRPVGSVVYSLMLDRNGGIRSDVTIARLEEERFQLGHNGPLDLAWLRRHAPPASGIEIRDTTASLCCLGLWGPRARDVLARVCDDDLSNDAFPYFAAREIEVGEVPVTALRVSYVGELGWELYAPAEYGGRLWDLLWAAGRPDGLIAAGRAAFESMRLEKGYRFWGADMTTEHNPYEAGVDFAVKLKKGDFVGRDALLAAQDAVCRRLCCLTLDDPSVVVMGKEPIHAGGAVAGYVTSAGFGYAAGKSIAYGYLPVDHAAPGTVVAIEYFGECFSATVAKEPLFDPERTRLR